MSAGTGACGARCIRLGFLGGTAVGALAGFAAGGSKSDCQLCGLAYLVTVPAGAVLGMIVGAVVREERWKSSPMPARLRVEPDGSGRFALGLLVGF